MNDIYYSVSWHYNKNRYKELHIDSIIEPYQEPHECLNCETRLNQISAMQECPECGYTMEM